MNNSAHLYADAFSRALSSRAVVSASELVPRLTAAIQRRGDTRFGKIILRSVLERIVRARGGRYILIETASGRHVEVSKKETDCVDTRVSSRLIAGVRITVNSEYELDMSFAARLRKLFPEYAE